MQNLRNLSILQQDAREMKSELSYYKQMHPGLHSRNMLKQLIVTKAHRTLYVFYKWLYLENDL